MGLSKVLTALSSRFALDEERKEATLYKYQTFYHWRREQQRKPFRRLFLYNFVTTEGTKKCQSKAQHISPQKTKNVLSKSRSWFKSSWSVRWGGILSALVLFTYEPPDWAQVQAKKEKIYKDLPFHRNIMLSPEPSQLATWRHFDVAAVGY